MKRLFFSGFVLVALCTSAPASATLPFNVVFKGEDKFQRLLRLAEAQQWKLLPIGERTAAAGKAMVGTPYKSYTLEIDDRVEAPSVNLYGLDCWTFFEVSLAFARMLDEPRENWTPQTLLRYVELDRYRGGNCTGQYLSRLHYLEEWLADNNRRALVRDLTKSFGGVRINNVAREMSVGWKSYRYLRSNPSLLPELRRMEQRVAGLSVYHVPKSRVAAIEPKLQNGDIIGITSIDRGGYSTSHVGLAYRDTQGVLRFMHASSPRNYGKVVIDARLATYLNKFGSHAGILVARPLK